MTKGLKLIFFAFLLAFIGFGIKFGIHNFTGLGPVPLRSAFAGRLPWISEDRGVRRFQFFYATNREDSDATFKDRGNVRGNEIHSGTFDVEISPYMPIRPFVWLDKNYMNWAGHEGLNKSAFREKLKNQVQESPQKSLLIIVWGFRDWFESAAMKTAYTAYVLDINTPVLMFDWPGNQGEGPRGYAAAQRMSDISAPDLGRVLIEAAKESGAENVWVMGSSLGCQTISDALVWIMSQSDQNKPKFSHIVFSAPDVSANAFDETFSESVKELSEHLTAYVSSNDRALLMSQWLNRSRPLGRLAQIAQPPEARTTEYEFEEALELLDLKERGAGNITIVDATPINSTRNLHHFFTDSPVFFDDLYQRLLRPNDIVSRPLHPVRAGSTGREYWILWND